VDEIGLTMGGLSGAGLGCVLGLAYACSGAIDWSGLGFADYLQRPEARVVEDIGRLCYFHADLTAF